MMTKASKSRRRRLPDTERGDPRSRKVGDEQFVGHEGASPEAERADKPHHVADNEGCAASALARRYLPEPPAKDILDGRHLLLELLNIELFDDIHRDQALAKRLSQPNQQHKEGDARHPRREQSPPRQSAG